MNLARQLLNASKDGVEEEVERLLSAGARADRPDPLFGWLPLHLAAYYGCLGVARLLLEAAPATAAAVAHKGYTMLHWAAEGGSVEVIKLLLEAAPAAATMLADNKHAPIHTAAGSGKTAAVQQLLEAAPELAFAPNADGDTPLHLALSNPLQRPAGEVVETARCLVRAAPAVQPALGALVQFSQHSATLFADLVARLPLTQEQWQSIPAPCPDLARVLPAVLERSTTEAGWLVGRLAEEQQMRLWTAALCLARAQHKSNAVLPAELSGRILALCLLDS